MATLILIGAILWSAAGEGVHLTSHDIYFTIGETVGRPDSKFPGGGLEWHYTPPCVAFDCWPSVRATADAPFTTVSHWYMNDWVVEADGQYYCNDKRSGFFSFLELPRRTGQSLEQALCLEGDEPERTALEALGWRVRESQDVASTPWSYQRYVQESRGEFSCAKPSYVKQGSAWISDRTLCYLASGKPAVVQHTGRSRFLRDKKGLFRFRGLDEAALFLEQVAADYDHQCTLARALATEHFDAQKVVHSVLERALG